MKKVIMAALLCGVACAGCTDSSSNDLFKEVKELREEVSKLRSEVHELRLRGERRTPNMRPQMNDADSRKNLDSERMARMEERRRLMDERRKMHEDRRREMEERRRRAHPEPDAATSAK